MNKFMITTLCFGLFVSAYKTTYAYPYHSRSVEALAMAKDTFDFISGVDKDAYIGKTLANMNRYDSVRAQGTTGSQRYNNKLSRQAYSNNVNSNTKYGTITQYKIQVAHNDEFFIINNEKFSAQTYCYSWDGFDVGDYVVFLDGSPLGACAYATIANLRTGKSCDLWCE